MIRRLNSTFYLETIAGSETNLWKLIDGLGSSAGFCWPQGLTLDLNGNIFVANSCNNVVRMINSTRYVSTFAGKAKGLPSDSPTLSTVANLNSPRAVLFDSQRNQLYIADSYNYFIRVVS